ncbi:GTP cyclohydrolase 1 feedback regulatory protein [Micropterus salmoides]|uniref:GTP cyclohydrolase 1 feedback regulatory protein n=2 Tax=Micropterus TaxID=27705 RepID=UPI0018EAA0ED|nr:GTP cyclohydrolase 1 feedback regulatory protein [Micropterus salmoides]
MLREKLRLVRRGGRFRIPGRAVSRSASWRRDCRACEETSSVIPRGIEIHRQGAGMPYMFISTQIRLETGPTNVGDEYSDPAVMNYLGARKTTMLGNNFSEYHVDDPPRLVLDKLEKIGFRLLTMTGVGQTLVWCLHKETE